MTEAAFLLISLGLVAACGVFVAAEFSLVTVDRAAVERAAAAGDARARGTLRALQTLSTQLSGAQVGITITNLAIGFLAEPSIARLVDGPMTHAGVAEAWIGPLAFTIGMTLATAVTMIFGELVPKNLALARPLEVAGATQGLQRAFTTANRGPIRVLNGAANFLLRALGIEPQEELRSARSAEELSSLVHRSAREGVMASDTATLLERSLAFGGRTAGDIRTPRMRVRSVRADDTVAAVIALARETGLSRFPVLGTGVDDIAGLVHVKQAVAVSPERRNGVPVAAIASPPVLVPDSLDLDELSSRLRGHGWQMAVVMDEYGGMSGVVTLEDLIEELVGEIADEHDADDDRVRHLNDSDWSISGLLRLDEIHTHTGVRLPDSDIYETVSGLMLHKLGRMPSAGDSVVVEAATEGNLSHARDAARLTVLAMDHRRIDRVRLNLENPGPGPRDE